MATIALVAHEEHLRWAFVVEYAMYTLAGREELLLHQHRIFQLNPADIVIRIDGPSERSKIDVDPNQRRHL